MVSPPFGKCGQPPAVVVQRLAAEAALPVYHDSTGFARVTLIYKKKRPEPKFGSLFGVEDGTFPRTKKQSSGLFFAACGRPCCSSPQLRIPNKNPHGRVRHGDLCLVRKMGLSRGLTNSPLDCWFRHCGAVALSRLAVPESGCASCAACLLRPPRLLRLPVSAAGGGRLCSKPSAPNTKQKSPWQGPPWGPLFGAEDGT